MCMVCIYTFLSKSEKKFENYTNIVCMQGFLVFARSLFTIILG